MWHSIDNKPTKPGIYAVAHFEGGKMISVNPNWAFYDGFFGPNSRGFSERIVPTHWMPIAEILETIENIPKENCKQKRLRSKFSVTLANPTEYTSTYARDIQEAWNKAERIVGKRLVGVRFDDSRD